MREVGAGPELYEKEIEDLVWANLELFVGDPLFPLRRQAQLPTGGQPDILALDKAGRVVVIEVKRDVDRRQLAQALEYAGWARSTNLDELATLYSRGAGAFFQDWQQFTESASPVMVNRSPRLVLVAHDVHTRTRDALRFLSDGGVPVTMVPVTVYEGDGGRRLVEVEQESSVTVPPSGEPGVLSGTQKSYMYKGHSVRIADLVAAGLLPAGTEVVYTRSGKSTTGIITADGNIQIGEERFNTPSAAGNAAVGHAVDGWVSWRVPSLDDARLADLRQQLLDREQIESNAE